LIDQLAPFAERRYFQCRARWFLLFQFHRHSATLTTNPFGTYKPDAAKDAWERTKTFFDKELKKASVPKGK